MASFVIFDGDNCTWNTELIRDRPEDLTRLQLFPDTLEVLRSIRATKALVTMGNRQNQRAKVKILGLSQHFERIVYCERAEDKGLAFARLIREFGVEPGNVVVVGDRVTNEIFYGNELGCVTVWMRYGKYAIVEPVDVSQRPHHTITRLSELPPILRSLNVS